MADRGQTACHGIVLLDKASGVSSNRALTQVKRLFGVHKAGHAGTLDPLASGLLPVFLGEATKLARFMLGAEKRYRASGRLGVVTDTADSEGRVVAAAPVVNVEEARLRQLLRTMVGEIQQVPPMYSAIKRQGQPLYKLARKGITVEREPRTVRIMELTLLRLQGDLFEIEVNCSKGTYIRTLIEDIGAALGCGAHLTSLRRLRTGRLSLDDASSLPELERARDTSMEALARHLHPMDMVLSDMPRVCLDASEVRRIRNGQPITGQPMKVGHEPSLWVALYEEKCLIGLGEALHDGTIAPRRLLAVS